MGRATPLLFPAISASRNHFTSCNRRLLLSPEPSCRASSSVSLPIPSLRGNVWSPFPNFPSSAASLDRRLPNTFGHRLLSPSARHRLSTSTSHNRHLLLSPEPSCRASSSSSAPPPILPHVATSGRSLPTSPSSTTSPCHHLSNAFTNRLLSPSALRRLPTSTSRNCHLLLSSEPSCRASSSSSVPHQFHLPSPLQLPTRRSAIAVGGSKRRALGDSGRLKKEKGAR